MNYFRNPCAPCGPCGDLTVNFVTSVVTDAVFGCGTFVSEQAGSNCAHSSTTYITEGGGNLTFRVWQALHAGAWASSAVILIYAEWHFLTHPPVDLTVAWNGTTRHKSISLPGDAGLNHCPCTTYSSLATITVYDDGTFTLA